MNKSEVFCKAHTKTKSQKDYFSDDFKDLIISMLSLDPNQRPTLDKIMKHPWVNGQMMTESEVR